MDPVDIPRCEVKLGLDEIVSIKEEAIDDENVNEKSDKIISTKEEAVDEDNFIEYIQNASFECQEIKEESDKYFGCNNDDNRTQESEPFTLCLVDEDGSILEHYIQKNGKLRKFTAVNDVNRKDTEQNRKTLKRKVVGTENNRLFTKSGRPNRDEILKSQDYFCSHCQKTYHGRKCFRSHLNCHFTICENRFFCSICHYSGKTVSHINRHLLYVHLLSDEKNCSEKFFTCTLCDKGFYCNKDLEKHMFVHTRQGPLKCSECDFSCTLKSRMETHLFSYHGSIEKPTPRMENFYGRPFTCQHCNYSCESKSSLKKHINRHFGKKPYKCPDCDYTCAEGGDLKKHRTIHSKERPFICDKCAKTFRRRSHVIIHLKKCLLKR